MGLAIILALASAILAFGIGVTVAIRERISLASWAFFVGMTVLAAEGLLAGLAAQATAPAEMVYWEGWKLIATSILPGIWLLFSVTYSRGDARQTLLKWWWLIIGAFVLPIGLAVLFRGNLITIARQASPPNHWNLHLGWPGMALSLLFLLSCILVLANIERTLRASVGTMRWRIKFMIVGLGILFAVRAYTSSQDLLFGMVD